MKKDKNTKIRSELNCDLTFLAGWGPNRARDFLDFSISCPRSNLRGRVNNEETRRIREEAE